MAELTIPQIAQLRQLANKRWEGVGAGNLIGKDSARELVRLGYADNSGGSPASLERLHITTEGRAALGRIVESGEVTCSKCGFGAMAHSLMTGI